MTRLLEEEEAGGDVKIIYDDIRRTFGMVPNLFKVMAAADPSWLEINWYREKKIMIDAGSLDLKTRELIAFAISAINHCDYCTHAHEKIAQMRGATAGEINHARQIVELFASFNAIANSYPELGHDIKPGHG